MQKITNKIRKIIKDNITILSNFSYLSILQLSVLIIPFITIPHLIHILGKELYGLVIFTQVIAEYFCVFISFGFSLFGAKEVSIHRQDKRELSLIISTISTIKIIFLLLSILSLITYFWFFPSQYQKIYLLAFWICITDIFFPQWFFQGIEKMKFITLISLGSKLITLILIFICIKSKEDILWFPLSHLVGAVISGIFSIYLIKREGITLVAPRIFMLKRAIKESYHFFLSNFLIQLYAKSNKAIVGTFLGMTSVAYYDIADKILTIIRVPQSMIVQVSFPRVNASKNVDFIKNILKISIILNTLIYIILFLYSDYLVLLLGGENMKKAVPIVKILALIAPINSVGYVMGVLALIPFGYNNLFAKMSAISAFSYCLMIIFLWKTSNINIYSISIVNVFVEILVSFFSFYFVYKTKIIWKNKTL